MKLIVGLGNPEARYAATRHNVGFDAAEIVRQKLGFDRERLRFHACVSQGSYAGEQLIVCRPQTYMNLSGIAVREIASFYKIAPEDILVICDDVALPFGSLRVRAQGSAGGHNGLKNIIAQTQSENFARIRLGVGEKPEGWDLADFVLAKFTPAEIPAVRELCTKAAEAALCWVKNGPSVTMNRFNVNVKKAPKEEKTVPPAAQETKEETKE